MRFFNFCFNRKQTVKMAMKLPRVGIQDMMKDGQKVLFNF